VQEGCGYKDTLSAHRYFAPLAKYFTVCITYQPVYVKTRTTKFADCIGITDIKELHWTDFCIAAFNNVNINYY